VAEALGMTYREVPDTAPGPMSWLNAQVRAGARYHVAFLGVDARPHGDGFKVHLGTRHGDDQVNGGVKLKMSQEEFARFREFIALAIAARDRTMAAIDPSRS
jgi:hypothetical protein